MRVGERGQVTIPKDIRDQFGLGPNSDVEFHVEHGSIILTKAPKRLDLDARPCLMALVRRSAGIAGPAADSTRAHVVLRARIPVVACRPVRLVGEAARPIPVARPCLMALVRGCASITGPAAHSTRAHVVLRTRIPVVARCLVRLVGEAARPIPVARPHLMALVRRSAGITGPAAHSTRAHVVLRARIPVVARCPVGLVGEAARPIPVARPHLMALVWRSAGITGPAAHSTRAHVVLRARIPVVACRPVRLVGEAARPIPVARPRLMALVWGCAGIAAAAADSTRAYVVLRACVSVVACRPVGLGGKAARSIAVAGASLMALVRGAR